LIGGGASASLRGGQQGKFAMETILGIIVFAGLLGLVWMLWTMNDAR
jgi:hypothetical protein